MLYRLKHDKTSTANSKTTPPSSAIYYTRESTRTELSEKGSISPPLRTCAAETPSVAHIQYTILKVQRKANAPTPPANHSPKRGLPLTLPSQPITQPL